ncbi:GTPase RsgA [Salinisphaera sp. T31B1]
MLRLLHAGVLVPDPAHAEPAPRPIAASRRTIGRSSASMNPDTSELEAIGWPASQRPPIGAWAETMAAHPNSRPARVAIQHRSGYIVATAPDQSFAVESLSDWQRPGLATTKRPTVGDWLLIEDRDDGRPQAVALLPRRTTLKRGSAVDKPGEQLIAANIDTVFIVCGLDADFNARRIERYLLLIGGDACPVVVLTKADRAEYGARLAAARRALAELGDQAIGLCTVDARSPDTVAVLKPWLGRGTTAVVVGSSGAGKSTLTNTLLGVERMKTGEVRARDARGRHTTTHRALLSLPWGACLIDTPGMREVRPTGEETLADAGFADIEALAAECRFRDCRHAGEPGCALRSALEDGRVGIERVEHFLKLRDELARRGTPSAPAGAGRPGARRRKR